MPSQAELSVLHSLESHIRNLQRIRRGMLISRVTWDLLWELERHVRNNWRAKRIALVGSGAWWSIGRVIFSTGEAYWGLFRLSAARALAMVRERTRGTSRRSSTADSSF